MTSRFTSATRIQIHIPRANAPTPLTTLSAHRNMGIMAALFSKSKKQQTNDNKDAPAPPAKEEKKTAYKPPQDASEFIKNYGGERARFAESLEKVREQAEEREWFKTWLSSRREG